MARRWARAGAAAIALAVAAAAAGPASAAVNTGQSGWQWGNPSPQGNQINDIGFSGGTGYAAGNFGTLLSTTDGGQTWTGLVTGITPNINKVSVISPTTVVIGGGCSARITSDGGQTFTRMPFSASDADCPDNLASQSFLPDGQTGFLLLANGAVLNTADGGQTFSQRTAVPGTAAGGGGVTASDITFTSATVGYAVTSGGNVYRTTDGANSWTPVFNGSSALNSVVFVNSDRGYAVGANSAVVKTTDGGTTWTPKPGATGPQGALTLTKVRCANEDLCLITTDQGTGLVRTANGGDAYSFVVPSSTPIFAAAFASATRAVAAGAGGVTVISNDGGVTWSPVSSRVQGAINGGLYAASPSTAYAWGAAGAIVRTLDGGNTWQNLNAPSSVDVADVSFPSDLIGFALAENGSVSKTQNGGVSWAILNPGSGGAARGIAALDANRLALLGPRGVRFSSNGGNDFQRSSDRDVARRSIDSGEVVGNLIFAYGSSVIAYSSNGGSAWRTIRLPTSGRRPLPLSLVDCASTKVCWAEAKGGIYRTTNGGRKWTDVSAAVGDNDVTTLGAASASSAYLGIDGFKPGADGAWVLATADGGRTWAPELLSPGDTGVVAPTSGGTDFALVPGIGLFVTTTGGNQGAASSLTLSASPRSITKKTRVTISGRLSPANGGEQVLVSGGSGGSTVATAASNGTFTVQRTISRTTRFVAQWAGDAGRAADGSPVLTVKRK